jgi:RNA recognition motif-containing protein
VIRDKRTGDSLQYAFIEFENQKDCEQAYFKMQGVLIDDHRIHVDFSQSVRPTPLKSTYSLHQHAQLYLSTQHPANTWLRSPNYPKAGATPQSASGNSAAVSAVSQISN